MYLCSTEPVDLDRFCRAALAPQWAFRGRQERYAGYLRFPNSGRAPAGLPQLPMGVWARFLLDELSLGNEEGVARIALNNMIKWLR